MAERDALAMTIDELLADAYTSVWLGTQIDQVVTRVLGGDFERLVTQAAESAKKALNAQKTAVSAAAGTKKADLIGDASLMYQLEPGQRLIITTGEAVVGITDAELEALAAYVDSLVDGEDDAGGDAGGNA